MAVVLAALAVRMVVPAGMMPGGGATLVVCPGHAAAATTAAAAMPGMAMPHGKQHGHAAHPAAPETPCAFTTLFAAALDGPGLPALAPLSSPFTLVAAAALIAFVVPAVRLWPPRTGPPLITAV